MTDPVESAYPTSFRAKEAEDLANLIKSNQSVVLVGMKRVGISNFLRFFLHNKKLHREQNINHLFIEVDMDDLITIEPHAFWKLVLKRLLDSVQDSNNFELKNKVNHLFLESIQLNEQIVTIDNVKKTILLMLENRVKPTLFLIRFDRLKSVFSDEFTTNLRRIIDSTNYQTSLVLTSDRPIKFAKSYYLKPANINDSHLVLDSLLNQYHLKIAENLKSQLLALSGGHIQYLNLLVLGIKNGDTKSINSKDEELKLLSEEIFASLTKEEQVYLKAYVRGEKTSKDIPSYLNRSGIIASEGIALNPLLSAHIKNAKKATNGKGEFTKKENLFFSLLKEHLAEIVERYEIIESVWPDQVETGVTDWAIDRLAARLRQKIEKQGLSYELETVVTRGYKLLPK